MDLGTRRGDVHTHDPRGREFGFAWRGARVGPAVGVDVVCDELHGEEFFVVVGEDCCCAVEHGGAVVVVVGEGGQGED